MSKIVHSLDSALTSAKLDWLRNENIRPYVFVRPQNRTHLPGNLHRGLDWFPQEPIYKNPLEIDQLEFADSILHLESNAFGPSGMAMPRWVFYDCAIVPGFIAGFAARTSSLSREVRTLLKVKDSSEWTPISLFIIIPTMSDKGEWIAHNLCSVNSMLPKEHNYYGIGFLSKAFGLWYANVETCCGITQWASPSIRLHAYYGDFEILTAYTPVHSFARTLTYRLTVTPSNWGSFFTKQPIKGFQERYRPAGFMIDPTSEESMVSFQRRLEKAEGPFYIDGQETVQKDLNAPLTVYRKG